MPVTYAIGDIHGHYDRCLDLLQDAGLIDATHHWAGADATLVFIGDYVDRGPDGIAVIDLVMRLQTEAARADGHVIALLGNHDLILALAYRFGRGAFQEWWLSAGGIASDLARVTGTHLHWLLNRPSMVLLDDRLYVHADAELYYDYGLTLTAVNQKLDQIIRGNNVSNLSAL
ncbi:MAG: metallophosphoesterase, partial [Anaerolineae bacterium]|nr:metallophosphoesterase [Anaerolineae bacterium]